VDSERDVRFGRRSLICLLKRKQFEPSSVLLSFFCRAVESSELLGGVGAVPFKRYLDSNLPPGISIVADIENIFYHLMLKRGTDLTDFLKMTLSIRLDEIPTVMRTCGFFPTEQEVITGNLGIYDTPTTWQGKGSILILGLKLFLGGSDFGRSGFPSDSKVRAKADRDDI